MVGMASTRCLQVLMEETTLPRCIATEMYWNR